MPTAGPVAAGAAGVPEIGKLESLAEVTAPGTLAAIAQPAATSPSPSADIATTPTAVAAESQSHSQGDSAERGRHDIARAASPPAPREWVALDASPPSEGEPSASSNAPREAAYEVSTKIARAPASDDARPRDDAEPDPRTRSPQATAAAPVVATIESETEAPPLSRTESRPRVAGDLTSKAIPARSRPPQISPEADDDIAAPPRRIVAAALRDRDERDARRQDHVMPPATRAPPPRRMRENSVEVRIGAVTLQVHAPPVPAAPQAPARAGFAPHRHYLRTW
jgi:hypothetical protein